MKTAPDYVLTFRPDRHTALWGCEDWHVSVHPAGTSIIANGPLAGKALSDVMPDFPLLVKTIDARERLSVQVHPCERTAPATGGDPKTEMWCLLSDGPRYAGLRPGVARADVEAAVADGSFEELLVRHDGKVGDAFFIPGGLVHAIGDGVKLYEVQQSSDTTFRLYDWGRIGADGRARELHVDSSLTAMDLSLQPPAAQRDVSCPFFDFRQIELDGSLELPPSKAGIALFVASGSMTTGAMTLHEGESALVPPGCAATLSGSGARIFVTRA